jgi:hypothetical protein
MNDPTDPKTVKKYMKVFKSVAHDKYWKLPTKPVTVKTKKEADFIMEAITYYVGGAELTINKDGTLTVTSNGYYHYIGA